MDRDYTITKVSPQVDEWAGGFGPMKTYYVQLDGFDGAVGVNQKPTTAPPAEGHKLFGHIESNQHGHKFKKAQNPNFAPNGGGQASFSQAPRAAQKPAFNEDGVAWGNALNVSVLGLKNDITAEDLIAYATVIFDARPGADKKEEVGAGEKGFADSVQKLVVPKDDTPPPSDADYQPDEKEVDGVNLDEIPF